MSGAELGADALEERLRRAEHALLQAIPRRALKALWALQQIELGPYAQLSPRLTAVYLINLLAFEEASEQRPRHCLLCHGRVDSRGGMRAHLGVEGATGPRCAVFPALLDIIRDNSVKRTEDIVERQRWREAHRR